MYIYIYTITQKDTKEGMPCGGVALAPRIVRGNHHHGSFATFLVALDIRWPGTKVTGCQIVIGRWAGSDAPLVQVREKVVEFAVCRDRWIHVLVVMHPLMKFCDPIAFYWQVCGNYGFFMWVKGPFHSCLVLQYFELSYQWLLWGDDWSSVATLGLSHWWPCIFSRSW